MEAQGFYKAEINISGDLDTASPILRRETKTFLYIECLKNSPDSQKASECLLFLLEFSLCESSCGNKRGLGSGLKGRHLPPAKGGILRVTNWESKPRPQHSSPLSSRGGVLLSTCPPEPQESHSDLLVFLSPWAVTGKNGEYAPLGAAPRPREQASRSGSELRLSPRARGYLL